MKPALFIVDMQERFYARAQGPARDTWELAIEHINAAIDLFKSKGHPIYVIEHSGNDDAFTPKSPDYPTISRIKLDPSMPRVHKTTGSVFASTNLEATLRKEGVTALIITGYCAEWCVLSTVRHAEDLGLGPVILSSAIASGKPERIRFVEEINDTISFGALASMLK